jgi:hypothetical protein
MLTARQQRHVPRLAAGRRQDRPGAGQHDAPQALTLP